MAPGFEIELVASEPDIAKPMNMAFDARGRLWVTDTLEYPYPVDLNEKGRDSIKVFTDTNEDGLYDQVTTFADGLNIPIGLYPYGHGVMAWSIPNIWWFEDTDGDGIRDRFDLDSDGDNCYDVTEAGFTAYVSTTSGTPNLFYVSGTDGSTNPKLLQASQWKPLANTASPN